MPEDRALSPTSLAAHRLAKAPTREIFDPWNNISHGHQVGDTNPGADAGWRESRRRKLQAQFAGGLANDGGERLYDLVGMGAKDNGLEYHARKRGIARGANGEVWGDVGTWAGQDEEKRRIDGREVLTRRSTNQLLAQALRSGKAAEEEICKTRGTKRKWEVTKEEVAQAKSESLVALAEDSDEIWDPAVRDQLESEAESLSQAEQGRCEPEITEQEKAESPIDPVLALEDEELWDSEIEQDMLSMIEPLEQPKHEAHGPSYQLAPKATAKQKKLQNTNPANDQVRRSGVDTSPRMHTPTSAKRGRYHEPKSPFTNREARPLRSNRHDEIRSPRQETPPPSSQPRPQLSPSPSPSPSPPPTPPPPATAMLSQPYRPQEPTSPPSLLARQPKPLFRGLIVFVSGSTMPHISDHALRTLLVSHGANVTMQMAKRIVTHVIVGAVGAHDDDLPEGPKKQRAGGVLSASTRQREAERTRTAGGKGTRFVHVGWVLESIKTGRRLPEARFAVGMNQEESLAGRKRDRDEEGEGTAERVPSTTQAMRSGPLTAAERAAIGVPERNTFDMGLRSGGRGGKFRGRGGGRAVDRRAVTAPGVPAGQQSVRSMFIHQTRAQVWRSAGFEKKKK